MNDWYLEITTSKGPQRVPFDGRPISLGRHAENRIPLSDTMSSRFHCVVTVANGKCMVRDLKSSNGTIVNGNRITETELSPGQYFQIGTTKITLRTGKNDAAKSAVPKSRNDVATQRTPPATMLPVLG